MGAKRCELPGFLLMLALSILYVEAGLDERFEELFYGLKAAVAALVAMAIVRLGRKFIGAASSFSIAPVAATALVLGAVTVSLTAGGFSKVSTPAC